MIITILCLTIGIVAISIYAYGLKQRIKELTEKQGNNNT